MIYKLKFKVEALKEWQKLDNSLKIQFKKKLQERLTNPHVSSSRLTGLENCYKIKLRTSGYRLVYQVIEEEILVSVVAVGKRDKNLVYRATTNRLKP